MPTQASFKRPTSEQLKELSTFWRAGNTTLGGSSSGNPPPLGGTTTGGPQANPALALPAQTGKVFEHNDGYEKHKKMYDSLAAEKKKASGLVEQAQAKADHGFDLIVKAAGRKGPKAALKAALKESRQKDEADEGGLGVLMADEENGQAICQNEDELDQEAALMFGDDDFGTSSKASRSAAAASSNPTYFGGAASEKKPSLLDLVVQPPLDDDGQPLFEQQVDPVKPKFPAHMAGWVVSDGRPGGKRNPKKGEMTIHDPNAITALGLLVENGKFKPILDLKGDARKLYTEIEVNVAERIKVVLTGLDKAVRKEELGIAQQKLRGAFVVMRSQSKSVATSPFRESPYVDTTEIREIWNGFYKEFSHILRKCDKIVFRVDTGNACFPSGSKLYTAEYVWNV